MKTIPQYLFIYFLLFPLACIIISCEDEKSDPFPDGKLKGISFTHAYEEGDSMTIHFTMAGTNKEATTFEWDFGDGDKATGPEASHTYSSPGEYTVTLTGFGEGGSGSISQEISAIAPPPIQDKPDIFHSFESQDDPDNTVQVSFQEEGQCFANELTKGEAINFGVDNPSPDADYPVTEYIRGSELYADIKFNTFSQPLDLKAVHTFSLEVYLPSGNDYSGKLTRTVELILADGTDCGGFFNDWVVKSNTISEADLDKWITVTFDFSDVSDRTDLNWMILRLGGSNHSTSGTFYIHNLTSVTGD